MQAGQRRLQGGVGGCLDDGEVDVGEVERPRRGDGHDVEIGRDGPDVGAVAGRHDRFREQGVDEATGLGFPRIGAAPNEGEPGPGQPDDTGSPEDAHGGGRVARPDAGELLVERIPVAGLRGERDTGELLLLAALQRIVPRRVRGQPRRLHLLSCFRAAPQRGERVTARERARPRLARPPGPRPVAARMFVAPAAHATATHTIDHGCEPPPVITTTARIAAACITITYEPAVASPWPARATTATACLTSPTTMWSPRYARRTTSVPNQDWP